jgi:hypothetical protein
MRIQRRAMMVALSGAVAGIVSLSSVGRTVVGIRREHGSNRRTPHVDPVETPQTAADPSALVDALTCGRTALAAHATALGGPLDV